MGDKSECTEKHTLVEFYKMCINIRTSGTRDYHNLSAAYLAATSIFIGFITFFFRESSSPFTYVGVIFFSTIGLVICFQMWLAQTRFRFINNFWEDKIKEIEKKDDWTHEKYFVELYDNRLKNSQEKGISWGKNKFGGRMKLLPWIFGFVFICIILISFFILWDQRVTLLSDINEFLIKLDLT